SLFRTTITSPVASRQCIGEDMYMFEIRFAESVEEDLRSIRIYYRNQILDPIEEQLAHEPDTSTRNRKLLENLIPPWQTVAPIRELRVGRSEEHTSELQSRFDLVCRLLL